MRYQNWDVLLFPEMSKVPVQEFRTACHVVQDTGPEFVHLHSMMLLPTLTTFIPGLRAGYPFRLSIHSWENPEPSRFAQNLSKHPDLVMFEARVFVDGRLTGYKFFGREYEWPAIIDESIVEYNRNGEPASLRFPAFHWELLTQNYWNAGDELGRIKVVIAEGFIRDSATMPFERVKNIVAFSFQHAPLDVLESNHIAWPNSIMWRQASFAAPQPFSHMSPRKSPDIGPDLHSHSPRRAASTLSRSGPLASSIGHMLPPGLPLFSRAGAFDPFSDPALNHQRQTSDTTMPDYSSSNSYVSQSRKVTDPMLVDRPERRFENMHSFGAYESVVAALLPSVPVNTPETRLTNQVGGTLGVSPLHFEVQANASDDKLEEVQARVVTPVSSDLVGSIRSRKENINESPCTGENGFGGEVMRKVAQPIFTAINLSNKRQRFVTPVALKVIDQEDEPRSSPILRKVSQGATVPDNKDGERLVLSGLEPNRI